MHDQRLTPIEMAAILAVLIIWGVNNAAAKVATEVMPPLLVGSLRFALAAACLVWFVRPPFPNWKSLAIIVLVGGPLHYGLIYLAFWLAQDVSPVSVATQLWIPFTALFAFLILGERLSRLALAGMLVAFFGVAWMTLDPHALEDWKAILVGAAGSAAWALTTVIARRTTSIPPLKMQGLLALVALPSLAMASAAFETGQVAALIQATPLVWVSLLWAGVVSSVIATSLVFWLVQKREAGRVTPYLLATPIVSIGIGWGFMGDVLTGQILAGAALTMGGVAVVAIAERNLRAGAAKA
ncbi:DMT family transporter [Brevundimonas sp. S30B]|uniref:DMT family transporter n=1 Tax=unclassified Brevundimonas TaxID=2622653 RepID=UPI001071E6FF|nr:MULTISPECIES: DMT family transporter [unclassified Brevundimonas]QBX38588.1 DMT family transporter [Brevundimonas sp. MF30-B]TFW00462.1 DMT family transporter [Brevundimonas sp. S30B]TFW01891.1 DMT family transporter [Brevundimonas sp. S30B]